MGERKGRRDSGGVGETAAAGRAERRDTRRVLVDGLGILWCMAGILKQFLVVGKQTAIRLLMYPSLGFEGA